MSIFFLEADSEFPDDSQMDEEGLIALSEELTLEMMLKAYPRGIFPWYNEGELVQWWCPDPRFVLYPQELKISKSMKQVLNSGKFSFTRNQAFKKVIQQCATVSRKGQDGTWLTQALQTQLLELHRLGWAISMEVWEEGELVGGLYGILYGRIFFGESMFSKVSNASKAGFIQFVQELKEAGILLIDCQIHTRHLESLGAKHIGRNTFLQILKDCEGDIDLERI
jgi:leucyl/phenylalanyl-tRNA---protein transferase